MDRRILFPALVATAWAQQASPAAAQAEKALRARVEQFYQLELDKKFRQAESLVAEESKDDFYNSNKQIIKGFTVKTVEFSENETRAKVVGTFMMELSIPGFGGKLLELPTYSRWKLENGQWYWYLDPNDLLVTPFGKIPPQTGHAEAGTAEPARKIPDLASLQAQVSISRQTVALTESAPAQTVTITNGMASPIGLVISDNQIQGVSVELEKKEVKAGEAAEVHFRLTGKAGASGRVRVTCSPLGNEFDIQVTTN